MSRIGKLPVALPKGVSAALHDGTIAVKGPKGQLTWDICGGVAVQIEAGKVTVVPPDQSRGARSRQGMVRTLIANMVIGVTEGYTRKLLINGVEYRVEKKGQRFLQLALGYSHPILFELPDGIDAQVERGSITLTGINKQAIGSVAAKLRSFRPVEPYKGKGLQYEGERVRRKEGKTGAA
jgi:large subunit ribosomal protein L6